MVNFQESLRPAQRQVLTYQGGPLGISAVPGSGKTFTLEALIVELIVNRQVPPERIGVFTYMRSSRANLTSRINAQLEKQGVVGRLDAFTLHSLALKILRAFQNNDALAMIEGYEQERFITRLTSAWLRNNTRIWEPLLPTSADPTRLMRNRLSFGRNFRNMCRDVIQTAKNYRLPPEAIQPEAESFLSWALPIYRSYQFELNRTEKLDYDDLGWLAVELLEKNEQVREEVESWYDYLLEDESQDSSPLQEKLLTLLSRRTQNLVRVGDPNQSIMGTFTTAEPRFFREFCRSHQPVTLAESSRSAPKILALANALVDWVQDHPLSELRTALVAQHIQTATSGPENPSDQEAAICFKTVEGLPEQEVLAVAQWAVETMTQYPEQSCAILVPTNDLGAQVLQALQNKGVRVLDLLRSNPSQRDFIEKLRAIAECFAQPASTMRLGNALVALGSWVGLSRDQSLRIQENLSNIPAETLLFPGFGGSAALPLRMAHRLETQTMLKQLAAWLMENRAPWNVALRSVVEHLHRGTTELYLGNYVIDQVERALVEQPDADWQTVCDELQAILEGSLNNLPSETFVFAPEPGTISVTTTHRAKGLEWDEVFLTGLSAYEYPVLREDRPIGLYFLDGLDMRAEALAQLRRGAGQRTAEIATEQAFMDLAAEKLRLLYVGITRAKCRLTLSVATRDLFNREQKPSRLFWDLVPRPTML